MKNLPTVLLVEDSPSLSEVYRQYLINEPLTFTAATNGAQALEMLKKRCPDLVLLDLKLPDMPGEDILAYIHNNQMPCDVIVITAHGSVDIAVDLMRLGAKDFLQKPIEAARLLTTVRNALEHTRLKTLVSNLSATLDRKQFHGFIGGSLPMQAVYQIISSAGTSNATIFITGESGTGKEVCAEAIHKQSNRRNEAFIPINCGAIPKDLMESEIFGHVKGAFTGAASDRKGAASLADGGTLFLDEIGEMSLDLQTKLLRFIQTGIIKKVGGSREETVDVRFICATNRDPLAEVQAGRFREDLYYRLNVIPVHIPALRERGDDIQQLALHFLKQYAKEDNKLFSKISAPVIDIFCRYNWPGNVRQLQNVLRNIVVLNNATTVDITHLPAPLNQTSATSHNHIAPSQTESPSIEPPQVNATATQPNDLPPSHIRPLAQVEREAIESAIALCGGNIPKAAALLDVSPSTIYRKKQAWLS